MCACKMDVITIPSKDQKTKGRERRDNNYTPREEELLINLVRKYQSVIENKCTNATSNYEKNRVWNKIATEFNAQAETFRAVDKLKNKYGNLKKKTRHEYSEMKMHRKGTGGGPAKRNVLTSTQETIISMLGNSVTGIPSEFDDDADDRNEIMEETTNQTELLQSERTPAEIEDRYSSSDSESEKRSRGDEILEDQSRISISTPLNHPKSRTLKVPYEKKKKTNTAVDNNITDWVQTKTELVELQKTAFLEEHKLKLNMMQESHDLKLHIMTEEWDVRKQILIANAPIQVIAQVPMETQFESNPN